VSIAYQFLKIASIRSLSDRVN